MMDVVAENKRRNEVIDAESRGPAIDRDAPVDMARIMRDFEYFAARMLTVIDKLTCRRVPFILNRPQRIAINMLEKQRLAGLPLRAIILKARQWGCSTVIAAYTAWLTTIVFPGRHVVSGAHTRDTSILLRSMLESFVRELPPDTLGDGVKPKIRGCDGMTNTRLIDVTDSKLTVVTANSVNAARGMNIQLAHLSEVAFWRNSSLHPTEASMRAITSGIAYAEGTMIVMESTADGASNYFHDEWERSVRGESDKTPLFVPWYLNGQYRVAVMNPEDFFSTLDEYERGLWERCGCSLEQIKWYRMKRREYSDHRSMKSEYPTTPDEAFCEIFNGVFDAADVEALREDCREPEAKGEFVGAALTGPRAATDVKFQPSADGETYVWDFPRSSTSENDYIAVVDVGGRAAGSDYSVITVVDRHFDHKGIRRPEVVATWRGHTDIDLLAWKAVAISRYYSNALLVIESNSLDSDPAEMGPYILKIVADTYRNLYRRRMSDNLGTADLRPGFHTNRRTKGALISHLVARVRDGDYLEHDVRCISELLTYERTPSGGYAAKDGYHDDLLMTRAIALYVDSERPAPVRINPSDFMTAQGILPSGDEGRGEKGWGRNNRGVAEFGNSGRGGERDVGPRGGFG